MLKKKNKNLSYSVCKEAGEGQNEHEASLAQQTTEDLPIYVVFCPSVLFFFFVYCRISIEKNK